MFSTCLDAAVWIALLDDVECRQCSLGSFNVKRRQRGTPGGEPLNTRSGNLRAVHQVNLQPTSASQWQNDFDY